MTPPRGTERRGPGPAAPAAHGEPTGAPLGGTRSLLEAVLRELNDGLHHQAKAEPIARTKRKRQQG
ncbi:hypothetical protein [Streptomyces sp. SYP-A7185]|uniref:hypothetical protein n=1 Tax=Streptomyces sp. SYP-A7185 TaxID=3040076 RepID=UPI0038F690F1